MGGIGHTLSVPSPSKSLSNTALSTIATLSSSPGFFHHVFHPNQISPPHRETAQPTPTLLGCPEATWILQGPRRPHLPAARALTHRPCRPKESVGMPDQRWLIRTVTSTGPCWTPISNCSSRIVSRLLPMAPCAGNGDRRREAPETKENHQGDQADRHWWLLSLLSYYWVLLAMVSRFLHVKDSGWRSSDGIGSVMLCLDCGNRPGVGSGTCWHMQGRRSSSQRRS